MTDVHLQYVNDVHVRVICDSSILMELSETFSYFAENYKWNPKYRNKLWDGKISLVNRMTRLMYAGLAREVQKFCAARDYTFSFDDQLFYDNVSVEEVRQHIKSLNVPDEFQEIGYQMESIVKCLRSRRRTLVSPTSSGKSFMIYVIATWYRKKTLIIVPSNGLVEQFENDIRSYGFNGKIDTSVGGLNRSNDIDADFVITTWQALENGKQAMPKKWFDQFKVVFGDEAHGCKAVSLIKILSNMENTPYRFGTTGTLGKVKLNHMTIQGLFGPIYTSITTREMIDQGHATDLTIKCIVLRYPEEVRKDFHKKLKDPVTGKPRARTYPEEMDWIVNNESRNKFIRNLAKSLEGNKIVFFRLREHGQILLAMFDGEKSVYYIDGKVKGREEIRQQMENEDNATLIASRGTTATGISIKKLHHMLSCHPGKDDIKIIQAIGRLLRKHKSKDMAYLYDIVDDLSWGKQQNYTLKHFHDRINIYDQEQHKYKIYQVGIK